MKTTLILTFLIAIGLTQRLSFDDPNFNKYLKKIWKHKQYRWNRCNKIAIHRRCFLCRQSQCLGKFEIFGFRCLQ
ncbi:unnamed protein product [Paramecium sonneborni]|uniref:Uncharacterized protein n=1 Tax=Paramecium sonneborni TaxID=65129 RepID=A0A8S1RH03_9CILI|nr:unnamed protein product [Paramecium sonneborni]